MKNRHRKKSCNYVVDEYGRITNKGAREVSRSTNMIVDLLAIADAMNSIIDDNTSDVESDDIGETSETINE